jgi:Osmosensitive K+ channel histidine kinase
VQVLVNFLGNAIKSSPEGSRINVDAERTQDAIEIRVTDSGPGVPEQFRETIFEPFEQVPGAKSREGTGFGLAGCKLIADAHGAGIGVRSSSGQPQGTGSTFWVSLPLGRPEIESEDTDRISS